MRDCSIATAVLIRARRAYERKVRARGRKSGPWAKLILRDISKWPKTRRREVADWLGDLAVDLYMSPEAYSDRFTARFEGRDN